MTTQFVSSGVVSSGIVVTSGNALIVLSGGVASATTVSDGGVEVVHGSAAGTMIASGGLDLLSSGGTTISAVLAGGNGLAAIEIVNSGGTASATTISGGGVEVVSGLAVGTMIASGGQELLSSGGVSDAVRVSSGGVELVMSGGTTISAILAGGNGLAAIEVVYGGGVASATTVNVSGAQVVQGSAGRTRHLWRWTSSMPARSSKQSPTHGVVPGRRAAASPGPITPGLSDQITARAYGFRAPAFGRPRNDGCGLPSATTSMREKSSMRAMSSMRCPTHGVVPGRRAAASPGPITPGLSDQSLPGRMDSGLRPSAGPGMTAAVCGEKRHLWRKRHLCAL